MKYWHDCKGEIELKDDTGFATLFSIVRRKDENVRMYDRDLDLELTVTIAEAIEALQEAIEWLKDKN